MEANIIMTAGVYNGFAFTGGARLKQPIPVKIIGVRIPCDPGFVVVETADGAQHETPTFTLSPAPKIDFSKLLTPQQLKTRSGVLLGTGTDGSESFIKPISECPLRP